MSAPYWQLRDTPPYWRLADLRERRRPRTKPKVAIYRAIPSSPELIDRAGEVSSVLEMRFAIFNSWQEINAPSEGGRFLELIRPGAFAKTIKESFGGIRAVLSHGKDPSLGATVLGKIQSIREEAGGAIARVKLFPSVPQLLLDGLRDGVYGASFRGESIKSTTEYRPGRSAHNPEGLPEITRLEIRLQDIGPTPFAAYPETTALLASATGESLPARSLTAEQIDSEHPYWLLGREPSWQLQRRDKRRGRSYVKA